ncbi:MAG: VanW family protein [Candidatus Shapirobacteria bacterium]|jgi:vancomycin resistance protein YoaR
MLKIKINYQILSILGLILVFCTLLLSPIIINYGKTAENTFLLDKDYSGLSREEITTRLDTDFEFGRPLTLLAADKKFTLNPASISASLNKDKLISTMLYRRLNEGIPQYIRYFFAPKHFTLEISYDQDGLDKYLADLSSQIDKPFVPSELQYDQGKITVKEGQIGQRVDQPVLKQLISSSLAVYQFSGLNIPVSTVGELPAADQITATLDFAKKLIGKSLLLTSEVSNIALADSVLIPWLDFDHQFNRYKISDYVGSLSASIKRDPVDAIFKFENNTVTEFRPALNGLTLDQPALAATILASLSELTDSAEKVITKSIPVIASAPNIKTESVNNLGIKELLGRGTSTFKSSSTIRNFNIEKGASIVNRVLVAPGDTFSFIKALGEVTLEAGYKKAYIIRAGKTELDVGGGICQVSTTFFRAMLNAGVDITERRNHAYRVGYYEEDMPPGYDATVFIPSPDLKFVNDTGHYVLIQNIYDGKNKTLTYEIYGTSDGRKTEITNYRKWGSQPPPPDIYIDDPTLPAGKVIQDEHRIAGLKTAFDWKVTRNDQIIHEKTFTSNFVPWAAVFRRGPPLP